MCHRVLRRSSLHRIPRVSRICPLQANHLRPRCRRPKATLRRSIQAYRIPQSATGTPYLSRIKVQIRARLNRQGAYLPTYSIAVHTSTTFTGMSMFMSCHAISYFSWPPRAQKCNYSCICIPASPNFPALLFVLSAANPRPHLLDPLSICFSLCALFSIC